MQHLFSHLNERMRDHVHFPHPQMSIRYFDSFMYTIALASPLSLVPQVVQVFVQHNVAGLSITTWFLLTATNALWAGYGVVHKLRPLMLSSLLFALLDGMVVFGALYYR